jgi:hypothetical protein
MDDDTCGLQSSLKIAPQPWDITFYVLVSGFSAKDKGSFAIHVNCAGVC